MLKKYADILIILSIILVFPLAYYENIEFLRIFLIYPLTFFIPGYLLIINLFPRSYELTNLERIIFSIGLSISIVPLVIFILNYTPFQITEESMLWSLTTINFILAIIASVRRRMVSSPYYLKITFNKKLDKSNVIIYLLSVMIIITFFYPFYMAFTPYNREPFTEFYILNENGSIINYDVDALSYENKTFIIGLVNHEKKNMTYYIKILGAKINYNPNLNDCNVSNVNNTNCTLINTLYNKTIAVENITNLGELNISLEPLPNDTIYTMEWIKQYETNYSIHFNETGKWEVWFILYKNKIPPNNETQCLIDAINGNALYLKVFVRVVDIEFNVSKSETQINQSTNITPIYLE